MKKARKVDSAAALFAVAEKLVPHVELDKRAATYLFNKNTRPGLSWSQWNHDVRLASAIYQVMSQLGRNFPWEQLTDAQAVDDAFARLRSTPNASRGTLLLGFHGGFLPVARELFQRRCEHGVVLGRKLLVRYGARRFDNSREALDAALDVLRRGGSVLMAADRQQTKDLAQLKVLGANGKASGGAAFLAHAAQCSVAWYSFVRDGDRFVPIIEFGPSPLDGEALAAYSGRLHAFYAQKIEQAFIGDPRSISLFGNWERTFAAARGRLGKKRADQAFVAPGKAARKKSGKDGNERLATGTMANSNRLLQWLAGLWLRATHRVRPPAVPIVDSVAALFSAAEKLAPRLAVDSRVVDFLFEKSRWPDVSRQAWEREVRLNGAIHTILRRSRLSLPWEQVTDVSAADDALRRAQPAGSGGGMLLLCYHGPFAPVLQELFKRRCEGGIVIGGKLIDRTADRRSEHWGDLLFAALNALRDGRFVFVAPDGCRGERPTEFTVLGARAKGGGGAAFLAHSTRCKTAWLTVNRDGHRFIPVVELGPAPLDGEKLAAFSARLHEFYEKKIEEVFTGDPRNIDVTGRWGRAFAAMANAKDKDKAKA